MQIGDKNQKKKIRFRSQHDVNESNDDGDRRNIFPENDSYFYQLFFLLQSDCRYKPLLRYILLMKYFIFRVYNYISEIRACSIWKMGRFEPTRRLCFQLGSAKIHIGSATWKRYKALYKTIIDHVSKLFLVHCTSFGLKHYMCPFIFEAIILGTQT